MINCSLIMAFETDFDGFVTDLSFIPTSEPFGNALAL